MIGEFIQLFKRFCNFFQAVNVAGDADVFGMRLRRDDFSALVDGKAETCAGDVLQKGGELRFIFSRGYRIYGVKLLARAGHDPLQHIARAEWSLKGSPDRQSIWQPLAFTPKTVDSNRFLAVDEPLYSQFWETLTVTLNSDVGDVEICEVEIYALGDQCGQPEIPINGHVDLSSDQLRATYQCAPGYKIDPESDAVRKCVNGNWAGLEPVCRVAERNECDNQTADATPIVFSILFGLTLLFGLIGAVYIHLNYKLVKKTR